MQTNYLSKILKLEDYVIKKIEDDDNKIIVYCHSKKRGAWHKDEYSTILSTTRIKTAKHIVIEDRVVILRIKQRKFFSNNIKKGYGNNCRVLSKENMIHLYLD